MIPSMSHSSSYSAVELISLSPSLQKGVELLSVAHAHGRLAHSPFWPSWIERLRQHLTMKLIVAALLVACATIVVAQQEYKCSKRFS